MIGKAFTWKAVADSVLTADMGRLFQRGMTSGKKEQIYMHCIGTSKDMSSGTHEGG